MSLVAYEEFARRSYGSLERPRYDVISKRLEKEPYRDLLEELERLGEVEDVTDLNCDVAFAWKIRSGEPGVVARLSVVGPYAAVFRLHTDGHETGESVTAGSCDEQDRRVIAAIEAAGFRILRSEELEQCMKINFPECGGNASIYQVFFSEE
ncbi:hypothetical protein ACIQCF_00380 [Streptomyces sp. NPDC088353]|uniref:hypothetical protein n=1 Tax=unclassified Streptomyces TaxID=2593676 RepID=UPI003679B809